MSASRIGITVSMLHAAPPGVIASLSLCAASLAFSTGSLATSMCASASLDSPSWSSPTKCFLIASASCRSAALEVTTSSALSSCAF
eukprot:11412917-Alexandrium_andersonii.AAC.1